MARLNWVFEPLSRLLGPIYVIPVHDFLTLITVELNIFFDLQPKINVYRGVRIDNPHDAAASIPVRSKVMGTNVDTLHLS